MIGSWSNRIIEESRCHTWDRHALDRSNRDVNYVALPLALGTDAQPSTLMPQSRRATQALYCWHLFSVGPGPARG